MQRAQDGPKLLLLTLLLLFLCLIHPALTASPTSFCKCTCFNNSTIIPLGGYEAPSTPGSNIKPPGDHRRRRRRSQHTSPNDDDDDDNNKQKEEKKKLTGGNCNTCNRKFCLSYNLPICKGAKEEDVFTACFQRDSRKDEAVVFIFIVTTGGLLVWAGVRGWVDAARDRRTYVPLPDQNER